MNNKGFSKAFRGIRESFARVFIRVSIRRKLMYTFILVATLPLLVVGFASLNVMFDVSYRQTEITLGDKVEIARLEIENRQEELLGAARSIASDNLVLLNLSLHKFAPIQNYIADLSKTRDLSYATILDLTGRPVMGDTAAKPNPILASIILNRALRDGAGSFTSFFSGGSDPALSLSPLSKEPAEPALVALETIRNFDSEAIGFVLVVDVLGDFHNDPAYERQMGRVLGVPFLIRTATSVRFFREEDSRPVAIENSSLNTVVSPDDSVTRWKMWNTNYLLRFLPLRDFSGQAVASLGIAFPESQLDATRAMLATFQAAITLLVIGISLVATLILSRNFSRPIIRLAEGAKEIFKGNFDFIVEVQPGDEIGTLAEEFNTMTAKIKATMGELENEIRDRREAENRVLLSNERLEERVRERTYELSESKERLQESLELLTRTQSHLIQREKQVALTTLVAGLAHEINTPIGTGITAASFSGSRTRALKDSALNDTLTRKELDDYLEEMIEASRIIDANLQRAANKIRFFKQVSVNQESEELRIVALKRYVDDIFENFRASQAPVNFLFENKLSEDLELATFPSAFYQILNGLLANARQHAFQDGESGRVTVEASLTHEFLELSFSDNGRGMDSDLVERAFEPFFTTSRASGNTGLGLTIVFNLINSKLLGEITCESSPGNGTRFILRLPFLPFREADL